MPVEIAAVETKYQGWARLMVATLRLPDGRSLRREIEDHGAAVSVLPYDAARRTAILVRQLRAPVLLASRSENTLEAIAGILEEVNPADCARREAMEEASLTLRALEHVATAWTMPGISTERMTLYLAPYQASDRVSPPAPAWTNHEDVVAVEIGLDDLAAMADSGALDDMKTLLLVQTLRLRRPQLFSGAGRAGSDRP